MTGELTRIMNGGIGWARVRRARSAGERAHCPLVHAGLGFAKLFNVQKFEPQGAFLSLRLSAPSSALLRPCYRECGGRDLRARDPF